MAFQNVRVTSTTTSVMSESLPALPFFIPNEQKVQRPGPVPFPMDGAPVVTSSAHHVAIGDEVVVPPVVAVFTKAHDGFQPFTDPIIFPKDHVTTQDDSVVANPTTPVVVKANDGFVPFTDPIVFPADRASAPAESISVVPPVSSAKTNENFWSFGPVPMPLDKAADVPAINPQYKAMLSHAFPTVSPDHPAVAAKTDTIEVKLYDQASDMTLNTSDVSTTQTQASPHTIVTHGADISSVSAGSLMIEDAHNPVQEAINAFVIKADTNEKGFYGFEPVVPSPTLTPSYFAEVAGHFDIQVTHQAA